MMTKLEQAARQVVDNGVQGTYAKYYSVPPADFEALREALAEQSDEIDWIETNKALAKEIIELKKQSEQEPIRFIWNGEGWIEADEYIWKTTDDSERRELYAAPQPALEPVARVTGYHGGRCVVEPLNRALVLPTDMALYAAPVQQVTRADLKTAFKEGFERAADLYAPNDGQEPYAYEVWDVQDQSFTMIYATQLKEFHWIEPENIARVLYTAPQPVQEPVAWAYIDSDGSFMDALDRQHGAYQTPLYTNPVQQADINLNCKSVQKRLATSWGYVKAEQQEPVGYVYERMIEPFGICKDVHLTKYIPIGTNLYAAPVRTKDLTDDEIRAVLDKHCGDGLMSIAYAVIAADREKNK